MAWMAGIQNAMKALGPGAGHEVTAELARLLAPTVQKLTLPLWEESESAGEGESILASVV